MNPALLSYLFQNPSKPAFKINSTNWSAASWIARTRIFMSGSWSFRFCRSVRPAIPFVDRCKSNTKRSGSVFWAKTLRADNLDVVPTTVNPKRGKASDRVVKKNLFDSAIRTLFCIDSAPLYQDFPNVWLNYIKVINDSLGVMTVFCIVTRSIVRTGCIFFWKLKDWILVIANKHYFKTPYPPFITAITHSVRWRDTLPSSTAYHYKSRQYNSS